MSSKYLLPCSCGKKIAIDTGTAGRMVRCKCGEQVEVPTLREIKNLQPVQQRQPNEPKDEWNLLCGIALAGALVTFVAAPSAIGLWLNRPVSPQRKIESEWRGNLEKIEDATANEIASIERSAANMTVAQTREHWRMLQEDGLFWLQWQKSGKLTRRQQLMQALHNDTRMVEYEQQLQINTNFISIALVASFVGVGILGSALFLIRKRKTALSEKRSR